MVVLSVKPQTLPHLKKELASMGGDQTVISVMAGVSLTHLRKVSDFIYKGKLVILNG